jgi:hypothetical protein
MAISIWFALAVIALVATIARNRAAAQASESKATTRKTPSDQVIRSPRHYPIVDARAYS